MKTYLAKYSLKSNFKYLIIGFSFFPLIPTFYWGYGIALLCLMAILNIFYYGISISRYSLLIFFLLSSLFWFYFLSLSYSTDISQGIHDLVQALSLVAFPLIFLFTSNLYTVKTIEKVKLVFSICTIIYCIFIFIYIYLSDNFTSILNAKNNVFVFRKEFNEVSDFHPTYMTIYLFTASLFLISMLYKNWHKFKGYFRTVIILLIILAIVMGLTLASRMPTLSFVMALIIYVLLSIKKWKYKMVTLFSIISIVSIVIMTFPPLKTRMQILAQTIDSDLEPIRQSDQIRICIFKSSIQIISKNIFSGIGLGDVQNELNKAYQNCPNNEAMNFPYNPHNQYLHITLSSGILALLAFMALIITAAYLSLKQRNYLFFSFIVFVSLCLITENILDRQTGIVYFCFFMSLFLFSVKKSKIE